MTFVNDIRLPSKYIGIILSKHLHCASSNSFNKAKVASEFDKLMIV